jgi:hypothetical protein
VGSTALGDGKGRTIEGSAYEYILDHASGSGERDAPVLDREDGAEYQRPIAQSQVIEERMSTSQVLSGTGNYPAAVTDENVTTTSGVTPRPPADSSDDLIPVDDGELLEEDAANVLVPPAPSPRRD